MAKIATRFYAVRPGNVYPEWIEPGERVKGRLAEIAAEVGALETQEDGAPSPASETETKPRRAPEAKG